MHPLKTSGLKTNPVKKNVVVLLIITHSLKEMIHLANIFKSEKKQEILQLVTKVD